jgi:Concanavalin A-like lectin/glucanases superfamily
LALSFLGCWSCNALVGDDPVSLWKPEAPPNDSGLEDGETLFVGLAGEWLCSGNTNDTSGAGNDGTGTDVTFVADRTGAPDSACAFNGTSSEIIVPNAPILNVTTTWSLSAWVRPSGFSLFAGIASKYQTYNSSGFTVRLSPVSPYTGIDVDGSDAANVATGLLTQGAWSHVGVTVSGLVVTCYVNGGLAYTGIAQEPAVANTDPLGIGVDFATRFFNGAIDDVRLYNRALSAEEIQELYQEP